MLTAVDLRLLNLDSIPSLLRQLSRISVCKVYNSLDKMLKACHLAIRVSRVTDPSFPNFQCHAAAIRDPEQVINWQLGHQRQSDPTHCADKGLIGVEDLLLGSLLLFVCEVLSISSTQESRSRRVRASFCLQWFTVLSRWFEPSHAGASPALLSNDPLIFNLLTDCWDPLGLLLGDWSLHKFTALGRRQITATLHFDVKSTTHFCERNRGRA